MNLINQLIQVVSNEKSTNILLNFNNELYEEIQCEINKQEEIINKMKENFSKLDLINQKICQSMELEILRIKFLIKTYINIRFKKIRDLITKSIIPIPNKLSLNEIKICEKISTSIIKLLGDNTLIKFEKEDENDYDFFVFFKALNNIGNTLLSEENTAEEIFIEEGNIYFAKYNIIKRFLNSNEIILI